MSTYFYPSQYPDVNDVVIAHITEIREMAVYCTLPAYGDMEAMIPTSEIYVKRGRRVTDYVKIGQQVAAHVIRMEAGGRYDLSLMQVNEAEKEEALQKFHRDQKVHLIVRTSVGGDLEKTAELYRDLIWKLELGDEEDLYELFEKIRVGAEDGVMPETNLPIPDSLVEAIKHKLPQKTYIASQEITLRFGIYHDAVQRLEAALSRLAEQEDIQVFVVAPPKYKVVATDKTPARAKERLEAALKKVPAPC